MTDQVTIVIKSRHRLEATRIVADIHFLRELKNDFQKENPSLKCSDEEILLLKAFDNFLLDTTVDETAAGLRMISLISKKLIKN